MPALSPVKKESVELGSSRMVTEENEIAKAGRRCLWEWYEKNYLLLLLLLLLLFRNIFFLKF
jgi:hypothetical protein